jgi:hypothetical protein
VTYGRSVVLLRVLRFPPPKKTDRYDITEMLLKVTLSTIWWWWYRHLRINIKRNITRLFIALIFPQTLNDNTYFFLVITAKSWKNHLYLIPYITITYIQTLSDMLNLLFKNEGHYSFPRDYQVLEVLSFVL